ncbi:acyltransferase [Escherichia coli]|nr:acyltransferase [Escherichia coli]HAP1374221.1 acyltransferase [Escherichia coli]
MSFLLKTDKTLSKNYQPGVDGLRAVAVILVLIFHVGFSSVPGGFVGVDVFFVISGYLITGIIFNQTEKGTFSYINFMLARIARLYPALIATLIAVFAGCFILYSPSDFVSVSKSAIYALYSASNIFFAQSVGYFDTSSEINPLLHTWSLGVEQQFYLVWPLIIGVAYLVKKSLVPWVLVIISIASLASSQWATINMQTEAYYWMPFRVFELSFGGLAFFISRWIKPSELMKESMMAAGLAMIVSSALLYSSSTQFPGLHAMIPVLGAMLCILSHDAKYAGFAVNNRVSVTIGLISYSVYLIHWPIIVFYKYWIYRELNDIEKASLILSSLAVGFLMYNAIENKFRKIKINEFCYKSVLFLSLTILVMISYSSSIKDNGFAFRIQNYKENMEMLKPGFKEYLFGGFGVKQGEMVVLGDKTKKPSFVFMGDSYARQYSLAMSEFLAKRNLSAAAFFADGAYLSNSVYVTEKGKVSVYGVKIGTKAIYYSKYNKIPLVYAQSWLRYMGMLSDKDGNVYKFNGDHDYMKFNASVINNIQEYTNQKVIVIGNHPAAIGSDGGLSCVSRPSYVEKKCIDSIFSTESGDRLDSNNYLNKWLSDNGSIKFINPYDFMCRNGRCNLVSDKGDVMYSDEYHLSRYGARKAIEGFGNIIIDI